MKEIRLTAPEGYFEESLERTLASAERIRRRRKMALCSFVAVVLLLGSCLSIHKILSAAAEKEYIAQQAEIARLDIFLEVNQ